MADPADRPCPHCGKSMPATVPICPHCGRLVDEALLNSGATMRIEHVWILLAVVVLITVVMGVVIALT
jgi:predicted amidophosphoribosyltransferase